MEFPVGSKHKALCEDGTVRTATVTRSPDTFFSVPARVQVRGKTVTGFLTCEDEKVEFFADKWRKNAGMLVEIPGELSPKEQGDKDYYDRLVQAQERFLGPQRS